MPDQPTEPGPCREKPLLVPPWSGLSPPLRIHAPLEAHAAGRRAVRSLIPAAAAPPSCRS